VAVAAAHDVTQILSQLSRGNRRAFEDLLPLVYDELRSLAARHMRRERPGHTLQATALTHEAYLRLAGEELRWENRAHFFAVAARAMRRILVEHARARGRKKRGGGWDRVTLDPSLIKGADPEPFDVLAVDQALTSFARRYPRKARAVELLYFGGLTPEEAGEVLGLTARTVQRDWRFARLWLLRELTEPRPV
jgi:RNA polymerase sigma factor (TIGR02999 family)